MNKKIVLSLVFAAGCGLGPTTASFGPGASNGSHHDSDWTGTDTWRPIEENEDPKTIVEQASARLADVITAADVGKTFGTDDAHIPYPDTYWPFTDNGIDARWNSSDQPSPLEKYMSLFDPSHVQQAKDWEKANHGSGVPGVQGWFGHCPGWTGAAMQNAPLLHAVYAKSDGQGGVQACNASDAGCVKLEIGDVNALEAEVYVDAQSAFIGDRCDTKPGDIQRDANGRITQSGCRGVNAGSLLQVAATLMKGRQTAFAIDAQNDFNTDEIWNQPAYRYHVYAFEPVTAAQAANLVAHGKKDGDQTAYTYNLDAKGFARVDFEIQWVSENGPNTAPVSGADSTRTTRMTAVIELDADASDPNANIIGGEYYADADAGTSRLAVHPFVWVANAPGPEDLSTDVGGDDHNPYVKPSLVKQLVAMGQQQ